MAIDTTTETTEKFHAVTAEARLLGMARIFNARDESKPVSLIGYLMTWPHEDHTDGRIVLCVEPRFISSAEVKGYTPGEDTIILNVEDLDQALEDFAREAVGPYTEVMLRNALN